MLLIAISTVLVGGSSILCGTYLGRNEHEKVQNVFSLNLLLSVLIAALFTAIFVLMGSFDLTGFLTQDEVVRPIFNRYLLGQTVGLFPTVLGAQLPAFLSLENKGKQTMTASIVYIIVNVILNFLFIQIFLSSLAVGRPLVGFGTPVKTSRSLPNFSNRICIPRSAPGITSSLS